MTSITLPRLVGTRDIAERIVSEAVATNQTTTEATVYARAVLSAAPSFVDAFVGALAARGVEEIQVIGGSPDLIRKLEESAHRRQGVRVCETEASSA